MLFVPSGRLWMAIVMACSTIAPLASAVDIDWVSVDDAGNAPDFEVMTCCGDSIGSSGFGAVGYVYEIGRFEVTNAQYTEFLNAVAATDTNLLYNGSMFFDSINISGPAGSSTYTVVVGQESTPVHLVSVYDAMRFANWLHNGKPTGAQDATTTEDGAYTITPGGIAANSITRNGIATVAVPTEDEWYKAAYYVPTTVFSYFDYPTGTNIPPTCTSPGATPNTANCQNAVGDVTAVGTYTASMSPVGTFDQGGNVIEWTETIIGDQRIKRGGGYELSSLASSVRVDGVPTEEFDFQGFRVVRLSSAEPVPSTGALALAVFGSLLGVSGWWKLRI